MFAYFLLDFKGCILMYIKGLPKLLMPQRQLNICLLLFYVKTMHFKTYLFTIFLVCVLFLQTLTETAVNDGSSLFNNVHLELATNEILITNTIRQQHQVESVNDYEPQLRMFIYGAEIVEKKEKASRLLISTKGPPSTISIRLNRSPSSSVNSFLKEYTFTWFIGKEITSSLYSVCFPYSSSKFAWFGSFIDDTPSEQRYSNWPMEQFVGDSENEKNPKFFIVGDDSMKSPLVDHLFVNTNGFAILLDDLHPWSIEQLKDTGKNLNFCFTLKPTTYSGVNVPHKKEYFTYKFRILMGKDIQAVHKAATGNAFAYIRRPSTFDTTLFEAFTWNLEAVSKLDSKNATDFFRNFTSRSKFIQQLHLYKPENFKLIVNSDEIWHQSHDYLSFDDALFHPSTPDEFKEKLAQQNSYLCLSISPLFPTRVDVQFENSTTKDDFMAKINKLTGETTTFFKLNKQKQIYLPRGDQLLAKYPHFEKTLFLEAMYTANNGSSLISSTVSKSSQLAIFTVLPVSSPTTAASLQRTLEQMLTLSMAGYPLILLELKAAKEEDKPSTSAFLQYLQLAVYTPALYLNVPYWTYFNGQNGTKNLLSVHSKLLQLKLDLAEVWSRTGEPILRPMWYAAPDDPKSWTIKDQFMLGPDVVVVPIIKGGLLEETREVYLPPGNWSYRVNGTQQPHGYYYIPQRGATNCTIRLEKLIASETYYFTRVVQGGE